jgi:hypothetical protein
MSKKYLQAVLLSILCLLLTACDVAPFNTFIHFADKPPTGEVILADGSRVVNGLHNPVILINNKEAINPTLGQLLDFLKQNNTDAIPYNPTFVCADFASKLYNDAESQGIRAAFVALTGMDHALNAFQTEDKGLIYIDFTGKDPSKTQTTNTQGKTYGISDNNKKVAYVNIGKPLGLISLDVSDNYGFDYSGYEKWTQDKQIFDSKLAAYNSAIEFDNYAGGVVSGSAESRRLNKVKQEINDLASRLGGFWDEGEAVTNIETFWQSNH